MHLHIEFGIFLKALLDVTYISGSKLAKAINVDPSLVSRWVNCKRVPYYGSPYISEITEYISKSIVDSYQLNKINDILEKFNVPPIKDADDAACCIKSLLLEAQGFSLSHKIQDFHITDKDNKTIEKPHMYNKPEDILFNLKSSKKISEILLETSESIALSSQDYVMAGCENVFQCTINLLNQALMSVPSQKPILITMNSKFTLLNFFEEYHQKFRDMIIKLLRNGWTIISSIKFDDFMERSHRFLADTMLFLKTGNYFPYLTSNNDHIASLSDMIIVPDVGALVFLCTKSIHQLDFTFFFKNKYAIEAFIGKFYQIIKYSYPIVNEYREKSWHNVERLITAFEETPGNQYSFIDAISTFCVSESIYNEFLKPSNSKEAKNDFMLSRHIKQRETLISTQNFYEHKDIFIIDSIEKTIINAQKTDSNLLRSLSSDNVVLLVLEHLNYLINHYGKSDNYEIALIDEKSLKKYKSIFVAGMNFYLKRNCSMVNILNMQSKENAIKFLYLAEPTTTYTLEKSFLDTWNCISPINKDKREVLAWLNHLREMLCTVYKIKWTEK